MSNEWGTDMFSRVTKSAALTALGLHACLTDEDNEVIVFGRCEGTPPTTAGLFKKGCELIQTDATDGTSARWMNVGTLAVPSWSLVAVNSARNPFVTVGFGNSADYVCDGTADNVQLQQAIDYVHGLDGGRVYVENGTFSIADTIKLYSDTWICGNGEDVTILQAISGLNKSIVNNYDGTNGNDNIRISNLTIDQRGSLQTAGGGMSFTGLRGSTFENVTVEQSYRFNLFVGSLPGTTLTGTITLTNGSETVTGVNTLFTSQVSANDILKSAGGRFIRVQSVSDDTTLVLDRAWGWATETGVTYKLIPANSFNSIINCKFNGTVFTSDNVGLGLFDDSLVIGNVSKGSTGYGFGPDHANRSKFIGNTCYDNDNAGIGAETCGYCVFADNEIYNTSTGVYLLSGAYRNIVSNNECHHNTIGIQVTYNSTTFPTPDDNTIIGNTCDLNTTHGIRVGGAAKTSIIGNRCFNNVTSGIVTVTDNAIVPLNTIIQGNHCYDNQTVKTQAIGIWISGGNQTLIVDNISKTSDNASSGITDSGTATLIQEPFNTEGFSIKNSAATNAINVDQNGDTGATVNTDGSIHVENTGNNGIGFSVYSNNGASATAPLTHSKADNTAFTQEVHMIENDGTGFALRIAQAGVLASARRILEVRSSAAQTNGTTAAAFFAYDDSGSTGKLVYTLNEGTGDSVFVDKNNSGIGVNVDQDANSGSAATGISVDVVNGGAGAAYAIVTTGGRSGFGTATPNAAAIVEMASTTQGLLLPRMTTTQRDAISSPVAGLVVYNTSTNKLNVYTTAWEQVTSI